MPSKHSQQSDEPRRAQRSEDRASRNVAHREASPSPVTGSVQAYSGSLLSAQMMRGRGNASVRIAALQRAQQTYGNRAVQRALSGSPALARFSGVAQRQESEEAAPNTPVEQALPVHVKGKPHSVTHHGKVGLKLQGKTKATFDGGEAETRDQVTEAATGCKGCKEASCVHVTGAIAMTFAVTTKVTLPKVPKKKPKLTPCQKGIVQDAIDTTLTDHEQEHVAAFEGYNGTVEEPLDITVCQKKVKSSITKLTNSRLKALDKERRKDANDASAALDPFNFDLDLSCEEPTEETSQATSNGGAGSGVVDVDI